MHQIYTVRGAKTRDALQWVNAIDSTIDLVANKEMDAFGHGACLACMGKGECDRASENAT
ncbi:hypothetical protein RCO48_33090 [Peribacillus frigoritolerans]|nr:hypothetical protein [Peribacillus frigoritolerans]